MKLGKRFFVYILTMLLTFNLFSAMPVVNAEGNDTDAKVLNADDKLPMSVSMETGVTFDYNEEKGSYENIKPVIEDMTELEATFTPDEAIKITDETTCGVSIRGMYTGAGMSIGYQDMSIRNVDSDNPNAITGTISVPVPEGYVPVGYSYQGPLNSEGTKYEDITGECQTVDGRLTLPVYATKYSNTETGKTTYLIRYVEVNYNKRYTNKISMTVGKNYGGVLGDGEMYKWYPELEAYFLSENKLEVDYNELLSPYLDHEGRTCKIRWEDPSGHFCRALYNVKFRVNNTNPSNEAVSGWIFVPLPEGYCVDDIKAVGLNNTMTDMEGVRGDIEGMAGFPVSVDYEYGSVSYEFEVMYTNYAHENTLSVTMPLGNYPVGSFVENGQTAVLNTREQLPFSLPHTKNGAIGITKLTDSTEMIVNNNVTVLEQGYDAAYKYTLQANIPDLKTAGVDTGKSYEGTLTLPVPEGYQANGAKVTYSSDYNTLSFPIAATSSTDFTITVPISLSALDYMMLSDVYVEYLSVGKEVPVAECAVHTPGAWKHDDSAHWRYCTVCKKMVDSTGKLGESEPHTWNNGVETTKATTEAVGVKTYTCTVCGYTKTETIPKLEPTNPPDNTGSIGGGAEGKDNTGGASTGTDGAEKTAVAAGTEAKDDSGATYTVKDTSADTTSDTVEVEYKAADTTEKTVTIPSTVTVNGVEATVTSIADNAFEGNKTVTTVTIPSTVEDIGDNAFKGCTKLTTVSIPASVEEIGSSAFENCTSLKKVTIPKNTESVGKNAFAGCASLTTVTIKSTTITKIGDGSFKNCKKLTKITITKNVTTIGKEAFSGDKKLKTITITSTKLKSVGKNAFKNVPKSTTIKVPKKRKTAYTKLLKKGGFKGKVK